jgi:hypothetical protein
LEKELIKKNFHNKKISIMEELLNHKEIKPKLKEIEKSTKMKY